MFSAIGDVADDIAGAIAFLLPGFLAISTYEATSPTIARNRSVWQWTMWSLTVSLLLVAGLNGVYKLADWPRRATDPEFYSALFGVALTGGYLVGRASGTQYARKLLQPLKLLQPRWIWYEVVQERNRGLVVHLIDGTVLYGYPIKFTDDSREDVREVLLTNAYRLMPRSEGPDVWEKFKSTEGVLVESPQIRFMQLLTEDTSQEEDE